MRSYYPGITIFKLAGSLMVVLAHVMLFRYMELVPNQQLQFIGLLSRVIVPCFYVTAGFLAYKGWTRAMDSRLYVRKYVIRILMLYGFFCVFFLVEHILPAIINNGLSIPNLYLQSKIIFMMFFLNGPFVQFWFIPPLIFGIAASYWLLEKNYLRASVIIGSVGFLISQFVSGTLMSVPLPIEGFSILKPEHMNYGAPISPR
jgi:hypothetical protein